MSRAGAYLNRLTTFGTMWQLAKSIKRTLEKNGRGISHVLRILEDTLMKYNTVREFRFVLYFHMVLALRDKSQNNINVLLAACNALDSHKHIKT